MKRDMKKKTYGFIVCNSKYPIDIRETTEKRAFIKLIDKKWGLINERNKDIIKIESLGEITITNP